MANYMTVIREIEQIVDNAPELNMNNYDEVQVDELNSAMIEICNILGNLAECESQEATNEAKAALPLHIVINWVACSDRLPEGAMGSYLACLENNTVHKLEYSDLTNKWWHLAMGDIKEHNPVKYWAELPEPPCL